MNLQYIFSEIAKADPEFGERVSTRRPIIRNFMRGLSLSAVPFALSGLFNKAYGKSTDVIIDTLNLVLRIEHLEQSFYTDGLNQSGLITNAQDRADITLIRDNEKAHRDTVRKTIMDLGGTPVPFPDLDYTGGVAPGGPGKGNGPFNDVLSNYQTFLGVSQTFENTGVRGLKGSAYIFMGNNELLTTALEFHSVEGRHAAHVQMMRRKNGHAPMMKPWITAADSMIPGAKGTAAQPSYAGEENTTQAGINIVNINGKAISQAAATEAFDEPITGAQLMAIVSNFIVF